MSLDVVLMIIKLNGGNATKGTVFPGIVRRTTLRSKAQGLKQYPHQVNRILCGLEGFSVRQGDSGLDRG